MRSTKSRSRNKTNRNRNTPVNNINRVFDSSGPEGKVRGTPQQIIDKYTQLSRDSFLSHDRVAGENFQQHAEHYIRLLGEAQRELEARRVQTEQQNRDRQLREKEEREQREQRAERHVPQELAGEGEQPEVRAAPVSQVRAAPDDNGLVETPESKPKRQPRARKPRKPVPHVTSSETAAPVASVPDANASATVASEVNVSGDVRHVASVEPIAQPSANAEE